LDLKEEHDVIVTINGDLASKWGWFQVRNKTSHNCRKHIISPLVSQGDPEPIQPKQVDLEVIVLHELMHGLGFYR
jgi:hypothetical protein